MAKSHFLQDDVILEVSDFITDKIYNWIRQQITAYSDKEIEISKDCYRVGNYLIKKTDNFWTLYFFENFYGAFLTKKHALLCCYYHKKNDIASAMDIRDISQGLIEQMNDYHRYSIRAKSENKNFDLYFSRLKQNEKKINTLKSRISLHLAKISLYKKMGNKNEHQQY